MSYNNTAVSNNYSCGWVARGQWIQLGNFRLWATAGAGNGLNARPALRTVSGTSAVWHSARQTWYNGNIGGYAVYISPVTTSAQPFNGNEGYSTVGDTQMIHFTDGIHGYRAYFMVGWAFLGNYLSLENLSLPHGEGQIGIPKINQWVTGDGVVTFGNLKVRVPSTGAKSMQFGHVTTAGLMVGQTEANFNGAPNTRLINKTSTTGFQYFAPVGQEYGFSTFGSAEIAEVFDTTNNVRYRVTCIYFSNNGGVSTNYFNITIEQIN